jgi:hypothetical protein
MPGRPTATIKPGKSAVEAVTASTKPPHTTPNKVDFKTLCQGDLSSMSFPYSFFFLLI